MGHGVVNLALDAVEAHHEAHAPERGARPVVVEAEEAHGEAVVGPVLVDQDRPLDALDVAAGDDLTGLGVATGQEPALEAVDGVDLRRPRVPGIEEPDGHST